MVTRDICYRYYTRFSHRTRDDVLHGALDSTQAVELLAGPTGRPQDVPADAIWVRTSQQCVCIYTAVYSQTLTAISIFKYVNIVCIIQVHNVYVFTQMCTLRL